MDVLVDREAASRTELPESGDAWSDAETLPLLFIIALHDEGHFRARADERHGAEQDIQQLRQFIKAGAAQETSDPRDSRIAGCCGGERISGRVDVHGAELVNVERLAVAANALLDEERGAGRVQADHNRNESKQRCEQNQEYRGNRKIDRKSV